MSNDIPTEYNEIVQFVRNNDVGVVAQLFEEEFTPNTVLEEKIEEWRETSRQKADIGVKGTYMLVADDMERMIES